MVTADAILIMVHKHHNDDDDASESCLASYCCCWSESVNCVMVDVNEVPGENPIANAIAKCWSTKFKLVQSNSEIVH